MQKQTQSKYNLKMWYIRLPPEWSSLHRVLCQLFVDILVAFLRISHKADMAYVKYGIKTIGEQ